MATNGFAPKKFEDFKIHDKNGQVVGHIRVKPNGVSWSPKGLHNWYSLTLKQFGDFAETKGRKSKK
jgi:hypothetical protein